jgi:thymidylate kinase
MLIILEGIDCSGKGFIGEFLLKNLGNSLFMKHGAKPLDSSELEINKVKDMYNTMYSTYTDTLLPQGKNLLVDRFYPSELVYSKPLRDYEAFDDDHYSILEAQIRNGSHDTLIIYVHADESILIDRMQQRGEDFLKPYQIPVILERYEKFINNTSLGVLPIKNEAGQEEMIWKLKTEIIPKLSESSYGRD